MDDGDSDEDDSGTLHQAAFLGEMKVLQKLLSVEGVDVNELDDKNGQTALYLAATAGRLPHELELGTGKRTRYCIGKILGKMLATSSQISKFLHLACSRHYIGKILGSAALAPR